MFGKNSIIFWRGFLLVLLASLSVGTVYAQVPMASFLCDKGAGPEVCVVYDNDEVKQLTNHKVKTLTPDWSPDGNFIVYSANIAGGERFDLRIIDMTDPQKPKDQGFDRKTARCETE